MKIMCPKCNHLFEYNDAACEDWSVPGKNFLCPNCKLPLRKFTKGEMILHAKGAHIPLSFKRVLIAILCGLAFVLAPVCVWARTSNEVIGIIAAISTSATLFLGAIYSMYRNDKDPLKAVAYKDGI